MDSDSNKQPTQSKIPKVKKSEQNDLLKQRLREAVQEEMENPSDQTKPKKSWGQRWKEKKAERVEKKAERKAEKIEKKAAK